MNKHIKLRIEQAKLLAKSSPCPRGQVGAVIFDPRSWAVISDGYNGAPRGGGELCGDHTCTRDDLSIISGTSVEIGCHHAEANALMNAARLGASTLGAFLTVTRDPCLNCAKLIHHSGIATVYSPAREGEAGVGYLLKHGVKVVPWKSKKEHSR